MHYYYEKKIIKITLLPQFSDRFRQLGL